MDETVDRTGEGTQDVREQETREWIESFDAVLTLEGAERAAELLLVLESHARDRGLLHLPPAAYSPQPHNTAYVNTIPVSEQTPLPGDHAIERRIKNLIRWNAMAMVVRANREESGIGGHISTYASAATLYEIGFNHFFRGKDAPCGGDQVFFQGHASPGMYAR
ncbi:MAG: pyruvate dehydrogenase (acetyl-transferring), homodimeric type, partial [Candidatus Hydrogenedentes bacterium]|nr:pyruvate dehydrogenase (acetyl-transferring), homodimeric type [Candidatus Hydrogenedentota bacterium]